MNFDFAHQPEMIATPAPSRRIHALFVCSLGRMRSLTAEHVFATRTDLRVAAAGIQPDAKHPVTAQLLQWADIVFVMEDVHRVKLALQFPDEVRHKQIVSLGIPDKYEYMDPQLVRVLTAKVAKVLG